MFLVFDKFSKNLLFLYSSIRLKKFSTPISFNISNGPIAQLNPRRIASSISLNLSVILGTSEEAYFIIFEITDHAYSPYLSFLFIKFFKSTVSIPRSIFLTFEYSPLSKFIASKNFLLLDLFIL